MTKRILKAVMCFVFVACITLTAFVPIFAADNEISVRYGITTATEKEKYVYELLLEGINSETPAKSIDVSVEKQITEHDLEVGFALFISDYPECFWVTNGYNYLDQGGFVCSVSPTYYENLTGDILLSAKNKLETAVNTILSKMPDGSNYDKALYLHDAVANKVVYEMEDSYHQTAYGALVEGRAVCAGYAAAYQLLMQRAGIPAWNITGESPDESGKNIGHAWNMVMLDPETCVYTDITWDDQGEHIYHNYFNLSKEEFETEHFAHGYFNLPECGHDESGYFDVNNLTFSEEMTVDEFAQLFAPAIDGKRTAVIYCEDAEKLTSWLTYNNSTRLRELFSDLGISDVSTAEVKLPNLGNEIHMTVTGDFEPATYKITVTDQSGMTVEGTSVIRTEIGEAMPATVFTAAYGYYFPENYTVNSVSGISVTRNNGTQITVSGIPTENVEIILPQLAEKGKEQNTQAAFVATGADTGVLSCVERGMKYSTDGKTWKDITVDGELELAGLSACTLRVARKGGETTLDSDIQEILISVASTPTLSPKKTSDNGGGVNIPTQSIHEYSTDGVTWNPCNGELNGLGEGTYYIRVKANGTTLASEAQTVVIELKKSTGDASTPDTSSDMQLVENNISSGCFSSVYSGIFVIVIPMAVLAVLIRKKKI